MDILRGYGMVPNMDRLLAYNWDNQQFVPKAGIFLGNYFGTGRKITQGDPDSPMIFNIAMNAVVRAILAEVCGP